MEKLDLHFTPGQHVDVTTVALHLLAQEVSARRARIKRVHVVRNPIHERGRRGRRGGLGHNGAGDNCYLYDLTFMDELELSAERTMDADRIVGLRYRVAIQSL